MRVVTAFHACRNFAPGDGGECRAWEETLTLSPRTNMYTNTYYYNYYYIVLQESHVSLRCRHCFALLFFGEVSPRAQTPCCKDGAISVPRLPVIDSELLRLFVRDSILPLGIATRPFEFASVLCILQHWMYLQLRVAKVTTSMPGFIVQVASLQTVWGLL